MLQRHLVTAVILSDQRERSISGAGRFFIATNYSPLLLGADLLLKLGDLLGGRRQAR